MANRSSRKHASGPGSAKGSTSKFTDRERASAVKMAEGLVKDGRSVRQASKEAGAAYRVSESTVQRWASRLDRPLSRLIQESARAVTKAAHAAQRQYTGADYRRAANELMHNTTLGIAQLGELLKAGDITEDTMAYNGRLQLGLQRAMNAEKALVELGFGAEQPPAPGERSDEEPLTLEEQVAEARALRDKMQDDAEAKRVAARERR